MASLLADARQRQRAFHARAARFAAVALGEEHKAFSVRRRAAHGAAPATLRPAPFASILPGGVAEEVLSTSLNTFLNLYNAVLIGRLILTWFPNPPEVILGPLSTLADPYLNLFRGLLPPLGQIDLSPILAFTVLNVFQGLAAALPSEMPAAGRRAFAGRDVRAKPLAAGAAHSGGAAQEE